MAEETAPKVTDAPKWAWAVLVALALILLSGVIVGSYFSKDSGKNAANAPQTAASSSQENKETVPEAAENIRGEKFLIFALLGVILLAIAFIPKLPATKFLGGVGALLLIFGLITAATFWTWPELGKDKDHSKKPIAEHRAPTTSATVSQLPANAVFVKTLAPSEVIYLTRERMDAPPPEQWVKSGERVARLNWPRSEKHRFVRNTFQDESISLFLSLPPGQSFSTSATDPALASGKQLAQAGIKPISTAAFAAETTSIDAFNGKYQWNGQVGYPEDR